MQEFCVKQKDLVEVISMLGVFGLLVSVCQMYPFLLISTQLQLIHQYLN